MIDRTLVELGSHQPGVPHRTADAPACLAALVLDAREGHTVYEPTSGECEILLRVAQLAAARGEQLGTIAGNDIDPQASLIGRSRLELAGIDARIGAEPSPGTVDRLIIDPGSTLARRDLAHWVRLLHRDGRVVMITRINGADPDLLAELPPTAIVFPPQRTAGSKGAVALWISHPFGAEPATCTIVDLRGSTTPSEETLEARLDTIADALSIRSCTELVEDDSSWRTALLEEAPSEPMISVLQSDELEDRLVDAVSGTLRFSAEVMEANEQYALSLARELERLIGGRSTVDRSAVAWSAE